MNPEYDNLFKLLVVGDEGVGKSCLLSRFVDDSYSGSYSRTIQIAFKIKTINLDGKTIKLQIWDRTGEDFEARIQHMAYAFYYKAHGVMVVYDCTDQKSFNNVQQWLYEIDHHAFKGSKLIIGNKCDLSTKKVIDCATIKKYAEELGIPFLETSAKNGTNVEQAFTTIAAEIKNRVSPTSLSSDGINDSFRPCRTAEIRL